MHPLTVLAVDIGAESGRAIGVSFDGHRLQLQDLHRFTNTTVTVRGTLHWDILRLWSDVQQGIHRATAAMPIASVGLDTWGVDFALLDSADQLIGNPVHYRDHRTDGMMEYVFGRVPRAEVFASTGIQIMPINTLYQLASLARRDDPALRSAARLLMVPDLLCFWLTGVRLNEYTGATTTQCFDVRAGTWTESMLERLDIPTAMFGEVTQPGVTVGAFEGTPVILNAQHDTGSAVIGVPTATQNFAYLSSGTWSLLGLEVLHPVINERALAANLTNEGGFGGTFRLLKNVMGLWLLQQSRATWEQQGHAHTYSDLAEMAAQAAPFAALVDPDSPEFLAPGDMPARLRAFCERMHQALSDDIGAVTRCIFESLALKYRYVLNLLIDLTGQPVDVIHVVGGGSQNALLCQMTADATGRSVYAGPTEATALGNAMVQLIALGELKSVREGRAAIRDSFPLTAYQPTNTAAWDVQYERFLRLLPA